MTKVRILSIDGGGIRGIIPGTILRILEQRIQKRVNDENARLVDYLDFVAGTSTGGILSLGMLIPDKENPKRPLYNMKQIVDLYMDYGNQIFHVPKKHKIASLNGVRREKYPNAQLKKTLKSYFGDTLLSELLRPCLITAYEIQARKAHFFTQTDARKTDARNYLVRDVAQATSAAPTYFEAALINSKLQVSYPFIDGGVFANNPALCAYAEVRDMKINEVVKPTSIDMFLLSLGTGSVKEPYPYNKVKDYGMVQWIKPLINIMMSGNSETVSYQLKKLFEAGNNSNGYIRIEPELYNASPDMDDASEKNLKALDEAGLYYISENEAVLERVMDNLRVPKGDGSGNFEA